MKTFTAEQFNKQPAQVYRTADREGSVRINNGQYADRIFILAAKIRGETIPPADYEVGDSE